ncbi:MAG: hypothetical protein DCC55_14325 [Chloroflexi bacterium]|nr:MAG: hypothetical protein DCC55_14325 [Chloroflexota bacterium]
MANHHFLSYSTHDGAEFALKLCDALAAGPPSYRVWLDQRQLVPGQDWDSQLVEAIRACASLLFVLTRDSVEDQSVCKQEWTRALRYKKPIVPLRLHADAELPFRLEPRQFIDFSGDFERALAQLRRHLQWLTTPAGHLQALKDRLADAQRDLRRTQETTQRRRIEAEITDLQAQITRQEQIVADPQAAAARVQQSIERGLERERQPERPLSGVARTKFIHPPPAIAPAYFQDRHVETRLIGDFLRDEARRLLTVVGRGGIGKTALVCRVLKALERGHLPDDGGPLAVDGIVYLSETGSHRVNVPNLLAGLCQLLPPALAERLDALTRDPKVATAHKMTALLEHFHHQPVVVLLDNLETLVDGATRTLTDADLDEALRALLAAPPHRAKLILTTRLAPRDLALHHPERQMPLNLDEGLESPYAENILRAMDADGTLGVKHAPEKLLAQAREHTRGYPRALEALFAILAADRDTTLAELLADATTSLPENVVQAQVGEAYSRLDRTAQMVMQALAIYGRPVPPVAVDYLLHEHLSGVDSAPVFGRLVNMHFAHKEAGRYYLHPVDQAYALAGLSEKSALHSRAGDYFNQTRLPRVEWRSLEDLEPQLAEFDLRCAAQEYETAWYVLADIAYVLQLWGHYRLLVEKSEVLRNKLTDATLRCDWLNQLAWAYYKLGKFQQAINRYEQNLQDARTLGMQRQELTGLNGLASCYADVGNTMQAIVLYQQALAICAETGRQNLAASILGNLGTCYADLGSNQQAKQYFEDAISIARQLDLRDTEASYLAFLADTLIVEDAFAEAIQCATDGAKIAEEIGSATAASLNNQFLAAAHLFAGHTQEARKAAESGRQYEESRSKHTVLNLIGLAALAQSDHQAARIAFQAANTATDLLLMHNPRNYLALDAKGLALCGLTLCEGESRVPAAIAAYRAARAATVAPGIVGRALRLFDALAVADVDGVLAPVRPVVAGGG